MLRYEDYISRHGEFGVQAIVEHLERYEGVGSSIYASLEERWNSLMQSHLAHHQCVAG